MPGRSYRDSVFRFGFNGKEKDDEVYGIGEAYDFSARIFDPRLGRWMSVDPLQSKYPLSSPYNFVSDNPITKIDPTGRGDFYFMGTKVGTDGKNDNEIYLVKDKDVESARTIAGAEKGVYAPANNDYSAFIKLPAQNVREAMVNAADRTIAPSGSDLSGNKHEEGGVFGKDVNGNEISVDAQPGDICGSNQCEINPYKAADKKEAEKLVDKDGKYAVEGTYHTHPKGFGYIDIKTGASRLGDNGPSGQDMKNVKDRKAGGTHSGQYSYILDTERGKVQTYDENGTQATMPLEKFRQIVKDHEVKKNNNDSNGGTKK